MYRIQVTSDSQSVDLGTCVPMDGAFGLRTRIPVKRLGDAPFQFRLTGKNKKESTFCPITQEEPFAHIQELPEGKLAEENGQIGIELPATEASDLQDNDPNP